MSQTPEYLFVQVVRAGGFKRAAEQLNLEPSSVSRKVAALEDRLRVKLLFRSTRQTRPTELGQRYFEGLSRLIDDQAALEEAISSRVELLTGDFRVSAPVDFGTEFVVPAVRRIQRDAPGLRVEILLGSAFVDLVEEGVDMAIRIGTLPDSDLIAQRLGDVPRVLVASPGYLERHGTPQCPEELEGHEFVFYTRNQARSDIEFADGARVPFGRLNGSVTVNSVRAVRQIVLEGAGIHLGPHWVFREALDDGRLVRLLPDRPLRSFPVHAVYVARNYLPRKTKLLIQTLSETLGEPGSG